MSKEQTIRKIFTDFNHVKALVIGDVMVDAYLWGKVDRISPEAPVPIVAVSKKESRLGGAANVAINLKALGAIPVLCSVTGDDSSAHELLHLLKESGLSEAGIIRSSERVTTVKTRVIGNNHQLIRVDEEVMHDLSTNDERRLYERISELIEKEQPSVVIFEDYDKGVLSPAIIQKIITACQERNIPTTADPKKNNFHAYQGVTLFKPNLHELKTGLKIDIDKTSESSLEQATHEFRIQQKIEALMVTLSEAGVFISTDHLHRIIPAHMRSISDVSGAGDTVISVASLCIALNLPHDFTAALSNLAGGLVCESVGVVPVNKDQLEQEAMRLEI